MAYESRSGRSPVPHVPGECHSGIFSPEKAPHEEERPPLFSSILPKSLDFYVEHGKPFDLT